MKKTAWKKRIKEMCEQAGTYRAFNDELINMLAMVLEERDKVYRQYIDEGANPCVVYTNKGGASNLAKNPLLTIWGEYNMQALTYFKELGLTTMSFNKLKDVAKNSSTVADILDKLWDSD